MIPLFTGDERNRRKINLGGTTTALSQEQILAQARVIREERLQQRRQEDAAILIQRRWRALIERLRVRERLKNEFDEDPFGINGMRCLVLLRNDDERLARWSVHMTQTTNQDTMSRLYNGTLRSSWLVLVRMIAVQIMDSVSRCPQSPTSVPLLKVINALFALQNEDATLCQDIIAYLMRHNFYAQLKASVEKVSIEAKASSPTLPLLSPLFLAPLTVFSLNTELYSTCFVHMTCNILTIPLLPYRLPTKLLTVFSAHLPVQQLQLLLPAIQMLSSLALLDAIHLLANLTVFFPPRYKTLSSQAFSAYLKVTRSLIYRTPASAFKSASEPTPLVNAWAEGDDSSDDDDSHPSIAPSNQTESTKSLSLNLDARVRARLRSLGSMEHANNLLAASSVHPSSRLELYSYFLTLYTAWPTCRQDILASVLVSSSSGLLRELYRGYVRTSPIGKDVEPSTLLDQLHVATWTPIIFLVDLYSQALRTMNDKEFFASHTLTNSSTSAIYRNPLTIDEVVSFSRQLMNIAFTLYWNEALPVVEWIPVPWEGIRDKVTALLQAIHARDSRQPFTPPDHWLCTTELDMDSFIEAATFDDKSINMDEIVAPRMLRGSILAKRMAHLSPRLGVLNNIPFAIPFETRVKIFRNFVKNSLSADAASFFRHFYGEPVTIRRDHVAADGFDKLGNVDLKGHIKIQFVDQFGQPEAGIDGGGLFKEFLTALSKEVFDTDRGLWLSTKSNELYPSPLSYAREPHNLAWYRFIGRILGKALYEGILVDIAFAGFFLAKWLGKQSYLDDLASLDQELYNGLLFLKNYDGNPEDLSLTFAVVEDDMGEAKTIDLLPNGSNIPVTRKNRLQYINLISHYRLTRQIKLQSDAFFEGLTNMIDPKWIRMFNQQELQILIGGVDSPIDLDDLRQHTQYGGSFNNEHPTVEMFWRVANTFDHKQRRALLRFATSCSRPPLLGFKELRPQFSIREAGIDETRLPSASTCVNLLKLPHYKSEKVLKDKLLQSITSNAGFDLS